MTDGRGPDEFDDAWATAVEQLETLGLSTYAARTYVALVSIGQGTARDVSEVAEVPRTRVYDATEELRDHGLVNVQQSSPRRFWAVSPETGVRTFERRFQRRTAVLTSALDELEPPAYRERERGVWTVEGRESVTDRVLEFVDAAEEEVVYMTVEELLTPAVVERLADAADRDVSVALGGVSPDVQERIRGAVPGAEAFESLWLWSDTPAGRLLLVDGDRCLVSVRVNGETAAPSDPRSERAIWGVGERNSLVVVLRAIFTWRLDDEE